MPQTQMHAAAALTSIGSGSLASSDILAAALSAALAVRRQLDAQHSQVRSCWSACKHPQMPWSWEG
jgi:hypothetical protein